MVIVVNTRLLLKGKLEGIGRFTYETLKMITQSHPEHRFIFVFDRQFDEEFVFSGNITPLVVPPPARHPVLWYLWFDFRIPPILKKYKADLFLSPDGYLSTRTRVPQLTVIHDLNFVHRPGDLPKLMSMYYNYFFPLFARKAARIATVSAWSGRDISASFGIPPAKIDIVYNGNNPLFSLIGEKEKSETRNRYSGGHPYFLYVGALHPRKNIEGLLAAYDDFRTRSGEVFKLVIAGGQMFKTSRIFTLWKGMKFRDGVVFTGRLTDNELRLVLGSAFALTFVSFFEGFGIPVVEAMAAGIPVICSATTALPEVGGDAAFYVNPSSLREIADAMLLVSTNEPLRRSMTEKGFAQAKRFTWERSADLLWASIEKCLADRKQEEGKRETDR